MMFTDEKIPVTTVSNEQGPIHGTPVADGWAGAVMPKQLVIQKCYMTDGRTDGRTDGGTDRPTDRHGKF